MLRSFLGSDAFTSGLQLYLKKYSFKNADTDYLWECLSEVTCFQVLSIYCNYLRYFEILSDNSKLRNAAFFLQMYFQSDFASKIKFT